ncbi:hypothetical protein VTL71DRAFT_7375 [Oculimacula yallundae]|uniref:Uncharacterized protein n=1 Tax=Oculimacula yallundae TaxID=86028 RepID=A0ABR4BWG5_9HELO
MPAKSLTNLNKLYSKEL